MESIKYEYNKELDILHVYSSEIKKGVKGCIAIGNATVDVGMDNSIIGLEIEEASKIFQVIPGFLLNLDCVDLSITNIDNVLFIGINLVKGESRSNFQLNFPIQENKIIVHH